MLDLSIIIVSYNARADLERCLLSLRLAPPSVAHDVVVVDNASSDGSPQLVRDRFADVRLIETGGNVGFARATNIGIRSTTGPLLLLLNSDTRVPAGTVDALVALLRSRPDVGAVGPRLVDERGRPEISFGAMIGPFTELRQKLVGLLYDRGLGPIVAHVARRAREEQSPDWISGACLLARREDAEAVELFDERYFLYAEDVDFCAAIRGLGKRILFTPMVEAVHVRGRSVAADPRTSARAYRKSQLAFYEKHHPRWAPLLRVYLSLKGELP